MPFFGVPIRNGLPIGLGSAAGFGIQPFDPSYLFANGEQGAWYDPSDYSTLFQDAAGATPVTAVEQPVGLMLDESKGLVLGSNIAGATSYTLNGIGNTTVVSAPADGWYFITARVVSGSGTVRWSVLSPGYTGSFASAGNTIFARVFVSSGSAIRLNASSAVDLVVDTVAVQSLPGNHAFQSVSASRPTLSARVNLLTKTEQFDDAVWQKTRSTVTANAINNPFGVLAADKLIATSVSGAHYVRPSGAFLSQSVTLGVYAKKGEYDFLYLTAGDTIVGTAYFDLNTGLPGTVTAGFTSEITNIGEGWYFCKITGTATATTNLCQIGLAAADNTQSFAGDNTSGIYIWGADLRAANDGVGIPAYQRVNTSTDYDTSGFPTYLRFDGSDDSMLTNSINFTATDKMTVWAGVRKLVDPTDAMLLELSSVFTNAGSFAIAAPWTSTTLRSYFFAVNGNAINSRGYTGYAAPISNVLSAELTTAAANSDASQNVRVNTVDIAGTSIQSAASTGNFGNYPLYIGRRNNATLPFNGRAYSLIVRGAASTDAQIASTESWVNGKTKAYA